MLQVELKRESIQITLSIGLAALLYRIILQCMANNPRLADLFNIVIDKFSAELSESSQFEEYFDHETSEIMYGDTWYRVDGFLQFTQIDGL